MKSRFWIFVLVVVIPYMGVVGAFPFYNRAEPFVLGFPFIYFWLFSCIPLTSLCMYIAYRLDPENKEQPSSNDEKTKEQG